MAKWGENDSNSPDAAGGGVEPEFGSAEWLLAQLNGGRQPSEMPRSPLLPPSASAEPAAPVVPAAPITPAAPATPVTPIAPVAAAPYEHARPVFPAASAAPVAPVSAQPAAPVQPAAPAAPVQPGAPISAQPRSDAAPQPVRPLLPPSPAPAYDAAENFARPRSVQPDFFEAAPTAVLPQIPPQAAAPAPAAPAVPFVPAPTYIPPTAQQPVEKPVEKPAEQPARSAQPARSSQPPVDQSFTAAFLSPAEELASMFADDDEADYKGGANRAPAAPERGTAAGGAAASASTPEAPAFQWGLVAGDEAPQTNAAPVPPVATPAPAAPAPAAPAPAVPAPAAAPAAPALPAPAPAAPVTPVAPLAPTAAVSNAASSDEASDDVLADWLAASMPAASGSGRRQGDASKPPTLVTPPAPNENPLAIPSVSSVLKPPSQPYQPPAPASATGSGQPQPYTPGAAFAPTFGGPAAQQPASKGSPFGGMSAASNASDSGRNGSGSKGSGSGSGTGSGSGSGAGSSRAGKKPRGLMIALAAVAAVAVLGGLFALGTALPSLFGGDSTAGSGATSSETAGESATPVELPPAPVPEAMQPPGEHAWDTLYGGECIDPFTSPWTETFTVVDCAAPHAAQLVYRGTFGGEESTLFPGEEALSGQINALCGAPGIVDLAAAAGLGDLQLQGSYPVTEAQWASGQHSYFCFVTQASGEPITGSIAGTGPAV